MNTETLYRLLEAYRTAPLDELQDLRLVLADALEECDDVRADVVRKEGVTMQDITHVVQEFGMTYDEHCRIMADLTIDGHAEVRNNTDELQSRLQYIVRDRVLDLFPEFRRTYGPSPLRGLYDM